LKLVSEFLGELRDISRAEISGLLRTYGGKIERETDKLLFFTTNQPEKLTSRIAFSKRIGRVVEDAKDYDISPRKTYAIREKKSQEEIP